MSLIRKLAGQTMIYGLGHILSKVLYFLLISAFLTYELKTTKSYGIYTDLYAYASILVVIFSYRIDTAFFRFGSKKANVDKAYSSSLIPLLFSTLLFLFVGLGLSQWIADILKYSESVHYVRWFVWIIALDVLMLLPYARLRLEERPKTFVFYRILNIVLTIIFVLFFLKLIPWMASKGYTIFQSFMIFEDQVDYVFLSNLIVSSLMFIFMSPWLLKAKRKSIDIDLWKKMVWYAAPLIIVGVANSINQFFAIPLQKFLLSENVDSNLMEAGVYAGPMRIAALIGLISTAFNYAAEPFFFKHAEDRNNQKIYGDVLKAFVIFLGFCILGMLMYLDILKHLIDYKKYASGFVIVPILLFANFFLGIYYNISIWYKLADKTIYGALISSIGAAITLIISITFLSNYGFIVSAWAALACYITMCGLALLFGRKFYPIDYPVLRIGLIICIVLGLYLLSITLTSSNEITSFLINTGLLISYVIIIYFLEKNFILNIVKKA